MSARGKASRYAVRATLADKREAVIVTKQNPEAETRTAHNEMVELKPVLQKKGSLGTDWIGDQIILVSLEHLVWVRQTYEVDGDGIHRP